MGASLNLGDWVDMSARLAPERDAWRCTGTGETVTFAEAARHVGGIARGLTEVHGLERGDRLAVVATDCHLYVELFLACARAGLTIVPLNYRLPPHEIETFLERSGSRLVVASERYVDEVAAVAATRGIPLVTLEQVGERPSVAQLRDLPPLPSVPVTDGDVLSLCFTSGTTGTSKAVRQTHGMLKRLIATFAIEYELGDPAEEFRYSASPMFHVAGIAIVLLGAARGFPMLIQRQFEPRATMRWMEDGLTSAFLVPTMLRMILDLPESRTADFSRLGSILYGAAPMTPTLLRESMEVFGCGFVNVFGAGTEAGLQTILSSADHRRALAGRPELLGSIGRPCFGVELSILDPDLNEVGVGEVGEIATRSDTLMDGYEHMAEATDEAFAGGWFRAGDLGRQDAEGYVYLAGRAKEMIIRGGENIYPVEVEAVLEQHADVAESAVVGRPHPSWGEEVVAFVTASGGRQVDAEGVIEHCRGLLARYKVPVEVRVLPELPRNAGGKVVKRSLLDIEVAT
ncbi:class I adenylate-forming enzyme family protein [Aeromicrobium alkaliterrae]|uniref:Fatty acid--CoA ligase n=1 Tax=Aeromicrobium alkaliterrae TaxID=302168 RepID=A0ABN2K1S5_9ACTN